VNISEEPVAGKPHGGFCEGHCSSHNLITNLWRTICLLDKGKTIILATKTDNDTYQYYQSLKSIYKNNVSYVFEEQGGASYAFSLSREIYSNTKKFFIKK